MPQAVHQWNPADYARHSHGQERWARELLTNLNVQPGRASSMLAVATDASLRKSRDWQDEL